MLKIGLTGGIASGKTTVASLFAKHGIPIIDADLVAAELVKLGSPHLKLIAETFGDSIINQDQSLNRTALAKLIFNDANARKQLDAILHPPVRKEITRQVNKLNDCYCVVCIPLLVETGQHNQFDHILVTDCSEDTQCQRLTQRDNIDKNYAEQMLAAQTDRDNRLKYATEIINTDASLVEVATAVTKLHEKYLALCQNTRG